MLGGALRAMLAPLEELPIRRIVNVARGAAGEFAHHGPAGGDGPAVSRRECVDDEFLLRL